MGNISKIIQRKYGMYCDKEIEEFTDLLRQGRGPIKAIGCNFSSN